SSVSAGAHSSSRAASSLRCGSTSNTAQSFTRASPRKIRPCVRPMCPAPRMPTLTVILLLPAMRSSAGQRVAALLIEQVRGIRIHPESQHIADLRSKIGARPHRNQSVLAIEKYKGLIAHLFCDED